MMKNPVRIITVALSLLLLGGCAQYQNSRGVEVGWQTPLEDQLERGQTTRQELLTKLGPPSQIVALGDETVLYYLFEHSVGEGLILVVYNKFQVDTRYDRAIFFFDDQGLLTDYSSRVAAAPSDG